MYNIKWNIRECLSTIKSWSWIYLKSSCISSLYYSLSDNNISDSGTYVLAEALEMNQNLQKLRWVQYNYYSAILPRLYPSFLQKDRKREISRIAILYCICSNYLTEMYVFGAETHVAGRVISTVVFPLTTTARAPALTFIGLWVHGSSDCYRALMLKCQNLPWWQSCECCNNFFFQQFKVHILLTQV